MSRHTLPCGRLRSWPNPKDSLIKLSKCSELTSTFCRFSFCSVSICPSMRSQHEPGKADDRVQRRAQLMADVGEELRLMPVGGFELFILFFELLKETNILDGDDGLIGESFEQSDLTFGEWLNFSAVNNNRADQIIFLEHGHRENAPYALLAVFFRRVRISGSAVTSGMCTIFFSSPRRPTAVVRVWRKCSISQYGHMRRNILSRNQAEDLSIKSKNRAVVGTAQTCGVGRAWFQIPVAGLSASWLITPRTWLVAVCCSKDSVAPWCASSTFCSKLA